MHEDLDLRSARDFPPAAAAVALWYVGILSYSNFQYNAMQCNSGLKFANHNFHERFNKPLLLISFTDEI